MWVAVRTILRRLLLTAKLQFQDINSLRSTIRSATDILPEFAGGRKNNCTFMTRLAIDPNSKRVTYADDCGIWKVKAGATTSTNYVLVDERLVFGVRGLSRRQILHRRQKGEMAPVITAATADRRCQGASALCHSPGWRELLETCHVVSESARSGGQSSGRISGRSSRHKSASWQRQAWQTVRTHQAGHASSSYQESATSSASRHVPFDGGRGFRECSVRSSASQSLQKIKLS